MQAQAKGREEDGHKHRPKAARKGEREGGGGGEGGDLQVCSHVASGLTHNSLPRHLGVVLQALHGGAVEGHRCRLEGGREDGLEAWLVCF